MKIIKKLDANGKVIYVNAENNEVVELDLTDNTPQTDTKKLEEALKLYQQNEGVLSKEIEALRGETLTFKENALKEAFIANGGNVQAWDVFKQANKDALNDKNLPEAMAKIKQTQGYFFGGSPKTEAAVVENSPENEAFKDSFYSEQWKAQTK